MAAASLDGSPRRRLEVLLPHPARWPSRPWPPSWASGRRGAGEPRPAPTRWRFCRPNRPNMFEPAEQLWGGRGAAYRRRERRGARLRWHSNTEPMRRASCHPTRCRALGLNCIYKNQHTGKNCAMHVVAICSATPRRLSCAPIRRSPPRRCRCWVLPLGPSGRARPHRT